MFGLGITHILVLAFLALILIGPQQLPEVARSLGRLLRELRRTTNIMTEQMKQTINVDPTIKPPEKPHLNLNETSPEQKAAEVPKKDDTHHG